MTEGLMIIGLFMIRIPYGLYFRENVHPFRFFRKQSGVDTKKDRGLIDAFSNVRIRKSFFF